MAVVHGAEIEEGLPGDLGVHGVGLVVGVFWRRPDGAGRSVLLLAIDPRRSMRKRKPRRKIPTWASRRRYRGRRYMEAVGAILPPAKIGSGVRVRHQRMDIKTMGSRRRRR